jgi:hypothetical protein
MPPAGGGATTQMISRRPLTAVLRVPSHARFVVDEMALGQILLSACQRHTANAQCLFIHDRGYIMSAKNKKLGVT